jgi:hypothetical protein
VGEVFVFVAFTTLLVFFVASLVVLGIVVQSAGWTVLPASREHNRELLRRTCFVGSSSPARFFHEAHMNVRTDLRFELRPLILAVVLVAALPLEAQRKGQYVSGQFGLNAGILPSHS